VCDHQFGEKNEANAAMNDKTAVSKFLQRNSTGLTVTNRDISGFFFAFCLVKKF
jgi:hypothetical protein